MSILASNVLSLLLLLLITFSTIVITYIINYEDVEIWLLEELLLRELPELRYRTVLLELELGKYSTVFERELRTLIGGDECILIGGDEFILIGGVGCVSTGNNTGRSSDPLELSRRSSEPRALRDDNDELNTGGVSLFLFSTGTLRPDALLILQDGTLPPSISNILSTILLNNDVCLSGCSCSCSASLLGLLDILLNSSFVPFRIYQSFATKNQN